MKRSSNPWKMLVWCGTIFLSRLVLQVFWGVVGTFQSASACDQGRECTNCTLPFRSVNSGMVHEVQEVSSGGNAKRCWTFTHLEVSSKNGTPMDTPFFIQSWPNFSFSPMVTWGFTISGNHHSMDKAKRTQLPALWRLSPGPWLWMEEILHQLGWLKPYKQ